MKKFVKKKKKKKTVLSIKLMEGAGGKKRNKDKGGRYRGPNRTLSTYGTEDSPPKEEKSRQCHDQRQEKERDRLHTQL